MPRFREISIHDLQSKRFANGAGVTDKRLLHAGVVVDLPPVGFGCDEAALRARGKEAAASTWGARQFTAADVICWTIKDAVVHGPYGVITVGGCAIRESFVHVPFGAAGYRRQDGTIDLPEAREVQIIGQGWHAASGAPANYYHWMLDILPKLQISPFAPTSLTGLLIMPPLTTAFQRAAARLLAHAGCGMVSLAEGDSAMAGQLAFIANMTGAGFAPHPCLSGFFDQVAAAFEPAKTLPRCIYVSRAGATRRRLANEAEVMARLRMLGYEICDPAALSFRDQIELFRGATHVVAPHGAGLANIVFCAPGTQLLELQMDTYMNLCFRKLAALRGLQYGCIVGDAQPGPDGTASRHAVQWSIDADRVMRALG